MVLALRHRPRDGRLLVHRLLHCGLDGADKIGLLAKDCTVGQGCKPHMLPLEESHGCAFASKHTSEFGNHPCRSRLEAIVMEARRQQLDHSSNAVADGHSTTA